MLASPADRGVPAPQAGRGVQATQAGRGVQATQAGRGVPAPQAWVDVCALDRLVAGRGVCALVGAIQVAVFRIAGEEIYALSNYDPFSRAFVLSRGIVGSKAERLKVASPVYKQSFDLVTGLCLDDATVSVPTFEVRVLDGMVQVASPAP